jgi:hypothetical protein
MVSPFIKGGGWQEIGLIFFTPAQEKNNRFSVIAPDLNLMLCRHSIGDAPPLPPAFFIGFFIPSWNSGGATLCRIAYFFNIVIVII